MIFNGNFYTMTINFRNVCRNSLGRIVLFLITCGRDKAKSQRMRELDFNGSTQKMGLRFTEELRDAWRYRWLKIKK